MTMTISEQVSRFVAMKQKLGYRFVRSGRVLHSFASFAEARNETFIRSETASSGHPRRRRHRGLNGSESCTQSMTSVAGCTPRMRVTKCRLAMLWAV